MYIKLSNSQIFSLAQLRAEFPNSVLPVLGPNTQWLTENGFAAVVSVSPPSTSPTQVAYQNGVELVSGTWRIKWSIRNMTPEEIQLVVAQLWDQLDEYAEGLLGTNRNINLATPSRTIVLKNNDRTKLALSDKMLTLSTDPALLTLAFQAENGWFDFDFDDFQELRLALDLYTQEIFNAKRALEVQEISTPFYTWESMQTAFDTILAASFNTSLEALRQKETIAI